MASYSLALAAELQLRAADRQDIERGEGVALFSERFIGGHRGVLAPAELAFMQLHAGREMRRFGYEPEPVHLGTRGRALFAVYEWPRQAFRMTGWRIPWDVPVEDFAFGFAMCTLALLLWERAR